MKHGDATGLMNRVVHRTDDLAVWVWWVDVCQVLGNGLAGNGEAIAVNQTCIEQGLHHNRNSTDAVDIVHYELTKWLEVSKVRHLVRNAVEVGELQINFRLASNCQKVKHSICRATESHENCDCIFKCLLGHDLTSGNSLRNQIHNSFSGAVRPSVSTSVSRWWRC